MRRFISYLAFFALASLAILVLLDLAYTEAYRRGVARNKFQYIMRMPPQHIDYVFLGSSRTANTIMPSVIDSITGKRAVNFAIEGANLGDNELEMKLLLSRKVSIGTVFLQVDQVFEKKGVSPIAVQAALPFVRDPVVGEFLSHERSDYAALRYLPFYRYMITDYAIGFREFAFTLAGKKNKIDMSDGFIPNTAPSQLNHFDWPVSIASSNPEVDWFRETCRKNGIKLVFFIAPVCSYQTREGYISKLKEKIPGIRDYTHALPDSGFTNCGHLNVDGARRFTKLFVKDGL